LSLNNEIGERFSTALSVLGLKNKEISEVFGVSSQQISNLKKADKINDLISRICLFHKININWILSGSGEMLVKEHSINQSNATFDKQSTGVDMSSGKITNQTIKENPGIAIGNVQGDNIGEGVKIGDEIDDPVALALFVQAWKVAKERGNIKELKIKLMDFCDDG
jgi:DNA-binding Xre family transcriptional regulator